MIIETLLIGLIIGILYYEFIGISPGGVIAPAYFSLYIYYPQHILLTIFISIFVYFKIKLLSSYTILFGKRRLLIAILLGFCLKYIFTQFIININYPSLDLNFIGYIIPGLIANEMQKQKLSPTLLSIVIVTTLIYLIRIIILNI